MWDFIWEQREVIALGLFALVFIAAFAWCDHKAERAWQEEYGEKKP